MLRPDPAGCEPQLCALASLRHGEDPAGSAFGAERFLLVELPLPWPAQLWGASQLPAPLRDAALWLQSAERQLRLLALAPDASYSRPGFRRVLQLRRPAGAFARYVRDEYLVPESQAGGLIDALLQDTPELLEPFAPYCQQTGPVRELLVCTHGSLDVCCGKLGFPLYQMLRERYGGNPAALRVWRVSHFGGHRFAPTLIDMPDGRFWGYLSPAVVEALLEHSAPVARLRPHYRGWSGLPGYFEQLAEAAAFEQEGWSWVDYPKASQVLWGDAGGYPVLADEPAGRVAVRIDFQLPDGTAGRYTALVEPADDVQIAERCRGQAVRPVRQYRVSELTRELLPAPALLAAAAVARP